MLGYALKLLDRDRLKSLMWGLLLGRADPQRLQRAIDAFTRRMLETNIRPGAREQIARDRAEGAMLVLATAAHEIYAGPIAAGLGFDAVLGTEAVCHADGRIGPGLVGRNVYGDSKLAALTRFLAGRQVQREGVRLSFYSDSSSDRPAFEWADEAVAVNPSRKLARLAAERGWPILDWGRP
jgi:HAD superfamily phosphoserine phosphatase-like hydrolase